MKLLEHEGKELLKRHGVPVPRAALHPSVPDAGGGWMVKAQVLAGGRGKRGGIVPVAARAELDRAAAKVRELRFGAEAVQAVLIEERLDIARELYLAAFVDRDRGRPAMIASAAGGVDIESVPADRIARVEIDPLIGLAGFQIRNLVRALALAPAEAAQFEAIAKALYAAFVAEDCELAEINPLVVTREGKLIAADAKFLLDDDAVGRHDARGTPAAWTADGDFMRRCRELDAIGVDNRFRDPPSRKPDVAVLGNGAGLTMATYDLIQLAGVDVVGAIELHGALARGVDHTSEVIDALFMLGAEIYFINAFYQLRSTNALAQALVKSLSKPGAPARERIVVRLRGVQQEGSRKIVEDAGCFYSASLREAAERALAIARAVRR